MPERELRIGLAGLGFMAAMHLRAYQKIPGARIAALCNPSGRHLDGDFSGVAGNLGPADALRIDMAGVRAYRNFSDLVADPQVDVVDICAPTAVHPELTLAALEAGKHVVCEKPLARTSDLAVPMVAAAERSSAYFMPAMCVRFWPEFDWLKQRVMDRRFGRVLDARFRRVAEPPAWGRSNYFNGRQSGGALLDLHIHDVDFIQYLFGPPSLVFAAGHTRHSGAIDHVLAQYLYPDRLMVSAEGSWSMAPGFGFHMSFTVNFEGATVDYDLSRGAEGLRLFQEGQPPQSVRVEGPDGYVGELAYFLDCVRMQRRPAKVTARDALNAVRLVEAEEESIRNGQALAYQCETK